MDGIFEKIEEVANKKNKNVTDVLTKAFHNIYGKYSNLSKDESKNENQKIKEHSKISLKKNKQVLLYNGKETAIIITYESAKNVSLEIIFLPIYIEDI